MIGMGLPPVTDIAPSVQPGPDWALALGIALLALAVVAAIALAWPRHTAAVTQLRSRDVKLAA
jgi:hypothetical protein